jgi:hypothetical protein
MLRKLIGIEISIKFEGSQSWNQKSALQEAAENQRAVATSRFSGFSESAHVFAAFEKANAWFTLWNRPSEIPPLIRQSTPKLLSSPSCGHGGNL